METDRIISKWVFLFFLKVQIRSIFRSLFLFLFLQPGVHSRTIILIQIKSLCPRRSFSLTCPSVPQNQFNILVLPVQCRVNVASYRDISVRITGVLRLETLHTVSFKVPPALDVLPRSRRGDGDMAVKPAFVCFSPPPPPLFS